MKNRFTEMGRAMPYDYPAKSLDIQARLMMLGFQPNNLMLMGAFITVYGMLN
jgi:hypothetical protein